MDRKYHLGLCRGVSQGSLLIRKPQQFFLAVAPADIDAEAVERIISRVRESVGRCVIRRDFNGNRPLVVFPAGSAPGAVLLLYNEGNAPIIAYAVVAACLPARRAFPANPTR